MVSLLSVFSNIISMTRSRVTLKYVSTVDIVLSRRFDVLFLLFFKVGPYVGGEHVLLKSSSGYHYGALLYFSIV